jgi:peptide/nickel transport system ATP-binding protein
VTTQPPANGTLLEVDNLKVRFYMRDGIVRAVNGVSFRLNRGETLGVVGESGCGKSVTALSVMRLVAPPGRIVGGQVLLEGRDVLALPEHEMRHMRGAGVGMIFQEPMTSLNPVFTVGNQIAEAVRLHTRLGRREAWERAVGLLGEVGIPEPARRAYAYPHEMSGGMRQRVVIAMAISCEPRVLIADEPTTALDVTIQADILDLLDTLRARRGMAVLLITHDLGVVAERADEVAIMYAGRIVEQASVMEIFDHPLHPYTRALFRSMPGVGCRRERLEAIPGQVPDLLALPSGCAFRDRCPLAIDECARVVPPLDEHRPGHRAACIRI